jgi:hypothetical protein
MCTNLLTTSKEKCSRTARWISSITKWNKNINQSAGGKFHIHLRNYTTTYIMNCVCVSMSVLDLK